MLRPRTAVAALLLALLSACSGSNGSPAAAPSPSSSPTASVSASPTASPRPSASPSPRASASRRPSPSPSARARATSAPRPLRFTAGVRYVFPVRGCSVSYGHSHHDYPATDIFAARGCRVVSPVNGVIDEVSTVDRWSSSTNRGADRGGLSFSVIGVDGVRYYGSHLSTVLVHPGQHVVAGEKVGTVGNTGSARGIATHLHFGLSWPTRHGIWWVRRGEVYPWPYLDSWRAGGHRSPVAAVRAKHAREGDVPPCRVDC